MGFKPESFERFNKFAQMDPAGPNPDGRRAQILWKICTLLRSSSVWPQLESAVAQLDQAAQDLARQGGSDFTGLVDQSSIDAEPTPEDLQWFASH